MPIVRTAKKNMVMEIGSLKTNVESTLDDDCNNSNRTLVMITKTTTGFVTQTYDDKGKCTGQEFVAGDQVDWEDENGEPVDECDYDVTFEYQPFDMVQPGSDIETLQATISQYESDEYDRQSGTG